MLQKNHHKYIFLLGIILILYFIFIILKPFISAILASIIFAFALYPLYNFLRKKLKNKGLAAIITILIIILVIIIPLSFMINTLAKESVTAYTYIRSRDFSLTISNYIKGDLAADVVKQLIDKTAFFLVSSTSKIILAIPNIFLNFFVMIFLLYYLFKDSNTFIDISKKLIPLPNKMKEQLTSKFKTTTQSLIYGILLTAIIQGLAGGIGFYIFKISNPILWGFIMMIASLLPVLGTSIIWLPAALFKISQNDLFNGIALLIYGALIISSIDNIIKPKFISQKAKVHPAVVLLGLLGGIKLFGFAGVLIGPLALALIVEFFKIRGSLDETKSS